MNISIDANIGAGKTTIIQKLNQELRIPIFLEPVNEWKELLNLYYNDQNRWAFTLNTKVLLSFNKWKNNNYNAIYERSALSCKNIFAKLNYEDNNINEEEMNIFNELYDNFNIKPHIFIYLKTDPNIAYERIIKRSRDCEKNISIEYIKKVHDKYEELFSSNLIKNIYIVDANNDLETVYNEVKNIIKIYIN